MDWLRIVSRFHGAAGSIADAHAGPARTAPRQATHPTAIVYYLHSRRAQLLFMARRPTKNKDQGMLTHLHTLSNFELAIEARSSPLRDDPLVHELVRRLEGGRRGCPDALPQWVEPDPYSVKTTSINV